MTDAITDGLEVSLPDNTPEQQEATLKDKQIANLAEHPGWLEIQKIMQDKIDYYKKMSGLDTSKLTLEEIGQKFIVSNLVADELAQVLNIVQTTANEINNAKPGK
jgi:lipase chaperone LimK